MAYKTLSPLLLLSLLTPACFDAQPAPLPDDGLEAGGDDGCVEEATVLADVEAVSALGFSAADVLAGAGGQHMSPMTWSKGLQDGPATVEFGPESGEGQLSVTIAYNGGEVRHIKSTPKPLEEGNEGGFVASCHDRLEVDVEVAVDSTGGALAETFTAPLRATTRGIATLKHEIAFDDLQGSLALTKVDPADAKVGPVQLDIGVSPSGLFGNAWAQVEVAFAGGVGATFMNIASWPIAASPCETSFGEAPVGLDDKIAGFSAADALALIDQAGGLSLTWQGGQPTALTLDVAHDGGPVCATYDSDVNGVLRFAATAAVKTDDGRWDGAFSVEVSARPAEDGTLAGVQVRIPDTYGASVPAADFAVAFGLEGVDLTGYDEGTLGFSGEFTPAGAASGQVEVVGVKLHMCSDEPGQGCEGNTYDTLETASWSTP